VTKSFTFDGIANGENVGVARAHLIVHADAAALTEFQAGHLREGGLRLHANGEDHDVRGGASCLKR
jgi:hypothetical protein